MHIWGPILLYLLVVAWAGLTVMPLCRAVFGDVRRIPLFSISLTCGFPLALLLFSLFARVNPNYEITVPTTLLVLGLVGGLQWFFGSGRPTQRVWDCQSDILFLGVSGIFLMLTLMIRANWPIVDWTRSESLLNLALHQSFLFGQGYPPENLWLAGEPIDYYILLRGLPGLVGWGWRILAGDTEAGGVIYVFSDAFTLIFASFSVAVWGYSLLATLQPGLSRRQAAILGICLGLGTLLVTHANAVYVAIAAFVSGAETPWWDLRLSQVPGTTSPYPIWNLILAEHHSLSRVLFVQVALFGSVSLLFLSETWSVSRIILSAALATTVLMSDSGSVLFDAVIFTPAVLGICIRYLVRQDWRNFRIFVLHIVTTGGTALVLSLPVLLHRQSLSVMWYWVESRLASPLFGFLGVQMGPLLFLAAACGTAFASSHSGMQRISLARWISSYKVYDIRSMANSKKHLLLSRDVIIRVVRYSMFLARNRRLLLSILVLVGVLLLCGRYAVAVAVCCSYLVLRWAPWHTSDQPVDRFPLVILAASTFVSWIFIEYFSVETVDAAKLGLSIRFNISLRFWLEGYFLIPLLMVLAWSPRWTSALDDKSYVFWFGGVATLVALLWTTAHVYAIADRIRRIDDMPTLDGISFFKKSAPCDSGIVHYLQSLDGQVRLAELCGTGEIIAGLPSNASWPGRIAAYSGRAGICGWTLPISRMTPTLHHDSPTGTSTWNRFRQYERNMQQAFTAAQKGTQAPASRNFLDSLEVTHVIVGDQELRIFPGASTTALAKALGGIAEYSGENGCGVVRLNTDNKLAQQYLNQAFTLHHAGRFNESIDASMQSLRVRPGHADTYNMICVDYNEMGKWDEAINACEKAIELNPNHDLAKNNLAFAKHKLRESVPE